jgi:hypothetical protein
MANIDVVPKQKNLAWLWIVLAIIVIAGVIWAFAGKRTAAQLQPAPTHLANASVMTETLPVVA